MPWTLSDILLMIALILVFVLSLSVTANANRADREAYRRLPPPRTRRARWSRMARWIAIWWVLSLVVGPVAFAQEAAYVTADPGDHDRVGLATVDGRYSLALAADPACSDVVPGNNVNVYQQGDQLLLQAVDPITGPDSSLCPVLDLVQRSVVACGQNPLGECDVAYAG